MSKKPLNTKTIFDAKNSISKVDDGQCKGCVFYALDLQGKICEGCISGFTQEEIIANGLTGEDNRIKIIDLLDIAMGACYLKTILT